MKVYRGTPDLVKIGQKNSDISPTRRIFVKFDTGDSFFKWKSIAGLRIWLKSDKKFRTFLPLDVFSWNLILEILFLKWKSIAGLRIWLKSDKKKFGHFPCKPKYATFHCCQRNMLTTLSVRMFATYMQLTCSQTVLLRLYGKSRNVNRSNDCICTVHVVRSLNC